MKAMFNGEVVAESKKTIFLENNHYFPADSVHLEYLNDSGEDYECPWKGHADYYNVTVNGQTAKSAAWVYPLPNPAAKEITGHYAFWHEVTVLD